MRRLFGNLIGNGLDSGMLVGRLTHFGDYGRHGGRPLLGWGRPLRVMRAIGVTAFCLAMGGCAGSSEANGMQVQAKATIRPDSSLTVFPVCLVGKPMKNVGDALGMMLEQQKGMSDIWPCELVFNRQTGADFDEVARRFGEFVKANAIETEYALYAEIDGDWNPPRVLEVRAAVVDKKGTVIWRDRQTPDDADFKRVKVSDPMTCCVLIADRLEKQLDRGGKIKKLEGEGRMARLWREKSGTPDKRVWEEMEQRQQALKDGHESKTLAVYPVQLFKEIDEAAGVRLTAAINDGKLFKVGPSPSKPVFEIEGNSNEQKRLWDLAKAFREHVRTEKPDVDYTLVAEYSIRPSDQKVWTVHFVICDRAGDWVIVDFQNDHHSDFKRVDPQDGDDCAKLIVRRLKEYLR